MADCDACSLPDELLEAQPMNIQEEHDFLAKLDDVALWRQFLPAGLRLSLMNYYERLWYEHVAKNCPYANPGVPNGHWYLGDYRAN